MSYISSFKVVFAFVIATIIFAIPGYGLARYLLNEKYLNIEEKSILDCLLGISISCTSTSLVAYLFGFNYFPVLFAIAFLGFVTHLFRKSIQKRKREKSELQIYNGRGLLLGVAVIACMMLILPSMNFGKLTSEGYRFKGLQITDLLHHMSMISELPKGIPPQNMYFSGEVLQYYWFSHVFPAFVYVFSFFKIEPKDIILLTNILFTLMFVGTLFVFMKMMFHDKKIILILMFIALFAHSYKDLFVMFREIVVNLPEEFINKYHLSFFIKDEWGEYYTNYSHGWFRTFLVEPQTTIALAIFFTVNIVILNHSFLPASKSVSVIQGFLLGSIFAMDSFLGVIIVLWFFSICLINIISNKIQAEKVLSLLSISVGFLMMIILLMLFKIINISTGGFLILKPYLKMLILSPLYFLLDYGPLILLPVWGFIVADVRRNINHMWSHIFLCGICLFFMFFIQYEGVTAGVLRKSGNIIRLPLLIFTGYFLQWYFMRHKSGRLKRSIPLVAVLIALPSSIIDTLTISDIMDKGRDVEYISREEYQATKWIKNNLPMDAVIQDVPGSITSIAAFGERRTALGDWQHAISYQIPVERVAQRHKDIYGYLFRNTDIGKAIDVIRKYEINYILLRPADYQKFPLGVAKFERYEKYFKCIYSNNGLKIYKVIGLI